MLYLDRLNRKAYCALSPRADEDLFIEFCEDFEYTPVIFTSNQTVNGEAKGNLPYQCYDVYWLRNFCCDLFE